MCFSAIIKIIFEYIFDMFFRGKRNLIYCFFEWIELWAEIGGIEWFNFLEFMGKFWRKFWRENGPKSWTFTNVANFIELSILSSRSTNCHQSTN
jgi:hypothetical protein